MMFYCKIEREKWAKDEFGQQVGDKALCSPSVHTHRSTHTHPHHTRRHHHNHHCHHHHYHRHCQSLLLLRLDCIEQLVCFLQRDVVDGRVDVENCVWEQDSVCKPQVHRRVV